MSDPLTESVTPPTAPHTGLKIVLWTPNYAPEYMGIPPLVTDCARWLKDRGHRVEVVTAVPNYPHRIIAPEYRRVLWKSEESDGVVVRRSWLRVRPQESFADKALYEATFAGMSFPNFLRSLGGADVVVCVVPSLLAAAAAVLVARRSMPAVRLVVWVQDLVLLAANSLDGSGRLRRRALRAAQRVESWVYRSADAVVVCSPGFRQYVSALGVDDAKIATILNWVDPHEYSPAAPTPRVRPRFVYAGNIGYTQGLETLIDAASDVAQSIDVDIVGDGNAVEAIRAHARRISNVRVLPAVSREDSTQLLREADALVLVQRGVSAGVNFPSKIGPYLASGRPVVAAIATDTPAADLLRASGGALVVEPENSPALASAMRRLAQDAPLRAELGERARQFAVGELSASVALAKLEAAVVGTRS